MEKGKREVTKVVPLVPNGEISTKCIKSPYYFYFFKIYSRCVMWITVTWNIALALAVSNVRTGIIY